MPVADAFNGLEDQSDDCSLLFYAQTAFLFNASTSTVVGVAVSGGSDSMALLHLLARVAPLAGWRVEAVTVDHRLRPAAADEAALVGQVCDSLGVPHQIVVWDHGPVKGNLMDAARQARYALIAGWATGRGIGQVAVAHSADDQAETFVMGLSRAAGLDGLSGMRHRWAVGGVTFRRPFLNVTRAELRGYLERHGLAWVDDPTNDDTSFTRVKARRALQALRPLGITVDRLATVVNNLSMAQGAVRGAVSQAASDAVREVAGSLIIDRNRLRYLGPEVARRLLIAALLWVSCAPHAPREASVARLQHAIRSGRDATLWGCRLRLTDAEIRITRELRAVSGAECPADQPWDRRWLVEGPGGEGLHLAALGAKGLQHCPDWRATGLRRDVLLVTPAVWQGDTLIAAPLAGKPDGWKARIAEDFQTFLVSH